MTNEELLTDAMSSLASGAPLLAEQVGALSHLNSEERVAFRRAWEVLTTEQRRDLLTRLHAFEVDNPQQEFNAVYHLGIEDPDPTVRRAAIDSIVEDLSAGLLDKLLPLAADDPDPTVREAAARALGPFALRGELGELSDAQTSAIERTLLACFERVDQPLGPRQEALASVGYLGSDRVATAIRRALKDPALCRSAIRAIGRSANLDWSDTLARQMTSPDPDIREEAARACGEMADERIVSLAINLMDDPSLKVRLAVIEALGQIGGDEARDALIYLLEDKRQAIRDAAELALADMELDEDPLGV